MTDSKYLHTLVSNIKHTLDSRGLNDADLSRLTGISKSFISDLMRFEANPSLEKLEMIERGLGISLVEMLKSLDSGEKPNINSASVVNSSLPMPDGFKIITAILSDFQAFKVRKWNKENCKKIGHTDNLEDQQ